MMMDQFSPLYRLVLAVFKAYMNEPNKQNLELTIKWAQLLSDRDPNYDSHLEASKYQINVLNFEPETKKYKLNAGATKQQYQTIITNCTKSKNIKQPKCEHILELRFDKLKISKSFDENQWVVQNRIRKLFKQFNILANEKQLRLDFNAVQISSKTPSEAINEKIQECAGDISKLVTDLNCIRVKETLVFYISDLFLITASKINQMDTQQQKAQFFQMLSQYGLQQIDQFINLNLPNQQQNSVKYEIDLKIPFQSKLTDTFHYQQFLYNYLQFMIQSFSLLDQEEFDYDQEERLFNFVNQLSELYRKIVSQNKFYYGF